MCGQIKVICKHCGERGIITKTERQTVDYSRLYCTCKNPACGHSWVANIEFSHTLHESRLTNDGVLSYLLCHLPLGTLSKFKSAIEQAEQQQLNFSM